MNLITTTRWSALVLAVAVAAGCAATPKTPEDQVTARATARWQALIDGKPSRAYGYVAPTVRANLSEKDYIARHGHTLAKAVQVRNVRCEAAECKLRVVLEADAPIPGMKGQTITVVHDETWVRQDGQWWSASPGP